MRFSNVCLEAVGYHLPDRVVSSDKLEERMAPLYERLKLPAGRLELMSGIRERRFWEDGTSPSKVAAKAGEDAFAKTLIDRRRIGCLISASVCRDFLEPATASVVHDLLKLPAASQVFDISNACLGVLNGMIHVASQIDQGHIEAGLIVAGEHGGPLVDNTVRRLLADAGMTRDGIKASFASLTIGSAAVAVLLTHRDISGTGHRLLGGVSRAATRFNHLCRGNEDPDAEGRGRPFMETDSERLMKEGCQLAGETWTAARGVLGWSNEQVDRVFCHQVGAMHRKLLYSTLGLDPAKDFSTLEFLGNTGAASLPVTLAMGHECRPIEKGQRVVLLGIGSGLNCLMLGLEW
jgi:3-oxoacyl-[acyl-carrier-protein] synthase-3